MEVLTLKDIVDIGSNGFLIYLVLRLLARIDAVTDRLLDNAEQASAERKVIARQNGLSTQDLTVEAQKVRQRQNEA